jgi:oligopeptidase B
LGQSIENTTGSVAWANDNTTLFYTTKNEVTLLSEKIWRYKLDTQKASLVYHETDTTYYNGVYRSKSGAYIIIWNSSTLSSDYHVLSADTPDGDFQQFTAREAVHEYSIYPYKDYFYILTNWAAQNFRLMRTKVGETDKSNWEEVIAHDSATKLEDLDVFEGYLVLTERREALTHLRLMNQRTGTQKYLDFSEEAYVAYAFNNVDYDSPALRYCYSSLTTPNSVYEYNFETEERSLKKQDEVVGGHNPSDYETKRMYAKGRDGVSIPLTIVYKKGFKFDGEQPVLLYAYGSYGHSIDPWFGAARLSLLDRGFAWAIAHIRGGEELGRAWYDQGKMLNKQNTFNDYVDCAKYLIEQKYTSANHLYAMGGSAGGLLMGAVINMNPELFNGVIAAVPFVDVVSTMLDESIPLTTNEFDEWGNPKDETYYKYMLSYSPYDNIKAQSYPNLLITTGLFDSQVQYWEPAKWIARLREMRVGNNLLLLKTNMEAGHGGASGRFKRYKEIALEYAFALSLEGIEL